MLGEQLIIYSLPYSCYYKKVLYFILIKRFKEGVKNLDGDFTEVGCGIFLVANYFELGTD